MRVARGQDLGAGPSRFARFSSALVHRPDERRGDHVESVGGSQPAARRTTSRPRSRARREARGARRPCPSRPRRSTGPSRVALGHESFEVRRVLAHERDASPRRRDRRDRRASSRSRADSAPRSPATSSPQPFHASATRAATPRTASDCPPTHSCRRARGEQRAGERGHVSLPRPCPAVEQRAERVDRLLEQRDPLARGRVREPVHVVLGPGRTRRRCRARGSPGRPLISSSAAACFASSPGGRSVTRATRVPTCRPRVSAPTRPRAGVNASSAGRSGPDGG